MAKTAKKTAVRKPAAAKPAPEKTATETNEQQIAETQRPRTRSQGSPQPPRSTSASARAGVSKRSKATKETKGPTVTEQNALWLQAIIQSLEGVQDDIRTIQENSAGGCPCLLGPSTGARPQIDTSCTGTQQQNNISEAKVKQYGGPAEAATQTSPMQRSNTATQTSPRQQSQTTTRTSPRLTSDAATRTSPRQKKSRAASKKAPYLDYPQNVEELIDASPCEVFRGLYNYWSTHRLLDPREFVNIRNSNWAPIEDAIDAINSVTEAITRQDGEAFSMWSRQGFIAWRTERQKVPINPEEYQFASRQPQDRLLIPFWIPLLDEKATKGQARKALFHGDETEAWGHTVLLEILPDTNGKEQGFTIRIYDSAEENFFMRHEYMYAGEIGRLLNTGLWGPYNWWEFWGCAKQEEGSTVCTIHAIVNGWSRALDLHLNVEFQGSDNFYNEAVGMINLALSGYLDSATIYAWLRCRRYVLGGSYEDVPKFDSTYPASNDNEFHRKKNSLLGYPNFEEYVDVPAGRPETASASSGSSELDEEYSVQAVYALMDRLLRESSMILADGVRANLRRCMREGSFNSQLNLNFRKALPRE